MKKNDLFIWVIMLCAIAVCLQPVLAQENAKHWVARYWEKLQDTVIQCRLCPRKCVIQDGSRGFCTVRINKGGTLYTLGYGNPVAIHIDPIEKKPFFHVSPGARVYSLAVAGCNMRCLFCQNWQISQAKPDDAESYSMTPQDIVDAAFKENCKFIAYTYTEPTVFFEYMLDIAKRARQKGIKNTMHSCGYINPEPLKELLTYMDAVNIDLKGFNEQFYRKMGAFAELPPVLDTLKTIQAQGVWLEITNLVIPGQNDSPEEIRAMCVWIKENLGKEVPVHFSRFMPAFKLANLPPTPIEKLEEAYGIARETGLAYVYIGNVPAHPQENTYCPHCKKILVSRVGYEIKAMHIKNGTCVYCGSLIAGRWH
jgi:pyruvate formate lyase activating enzyme